MYLTDPVNEARAQIAETRRSRRTIAGAFGAALVVSQLTNLGVFAWAASVARNAESRVKTLAIALDANYTPIGVYEANYNWQPVAGTWIGFAKQWTESFRTLPTDERVRRKNETWLGKVTDIKLAGRLTADIQRRNGELGGTAVYVSGFTAHIQSQLENGVVQVYCEWTEEPANPMIKPRTWTGIIALSYRRPSTTTEVLDNPGGIYAVDFSAMPRA